MLLNRLLVELRSDLPSLFSDGSDVKTDLLAQGQKLGLPPRMQINWIGPLVVDSVVGHGFHIDIPLVKDLKKSLSSREFSIVVLK